MTTTPARRRARQSPLGDTSRPGETSTAPRRRVPARPNLLEATAHLRPRDQVLTQLLDEHRTLTTTQITAALFDARGTARNRLYALRGIGWVDRFTPFRAAGRLDTHWVLGPLGAHWAAHHNGRTPPTPRVARERRESIAASAHLEHTDGANQVFIDLLVHVRTHPEARLARWWSPARTAAALGQRVHPDGHGVWEELDPGTGRRTQVGFFLEYDTGTETLQRLKDKTEPYRRLHRDGGPDYPVLLWLPNATREANLHRKLNGEAAHLGITLATTTPTVVSAHRDHIAGPIWKLAGNGRCRHRLSELPSRPGRAGPYHPGPPAPEHDPLHLLKPMGDSP
jgi:hypothetical protein